MLKTFIVSAEFLCRKFKKKLSIELFNVWPKRVVYNNEKLMPMQTSDSGNGVALRNIPVHARALPLELCSSSPSVKFRFCSLGRARVVRSPSRPLLLSPLSSGNR
jgi:hypothetical protein